MFDLDNLAKSRLRHISKAQSLCYWLLLVMFFAGFAKQSATAQQPKAKAKVAQDMARWETPPNSKQKSAKQTRPKKSPPAPKVVPAAPKPTPKLTVATNKARKPKRVTKPFISQAPAETGDQDSLSELPAVEQYGTTQHQKLFSVTFNSTQPNIEVRVDGESLGIIDDKLTLTLKLKPGTHTVTLYRNGFEQQDISLDVKVTGKNIVSVPTLKSVVIIPRSTPETITPTPTPVASVALPVPTSTPTPTPTPVAAANPGPNTVEVLRALDALLQRYKDPARSNLITAQDWGEARSLLAPVLRRDAGNSELTARDFLAEGQLLFLEKNYFEARQKFREGVRVMPNSAVLQYALGNTFLISNEPGVAIEHFRAAVSQEQSFALAHKALADAYSKMGDIKNAQAEYLRARSLGFIAPEISASLGRNLMREPTWLQAIAELSAAAERAPTGEIYLNLATCFEALKRPLSSLEAYQSAIKIEPNNAEIYYRLGELLFTLNEFNRAADSFEKYLIKAPDDPKTRRDAARQKANEARRRVETGK